MHITKALVLATSLVVATGCALEQPELAETQSALLGGFSKSVTKDGHTFSLTCGVPEGYTIPGSGNVAVVCDGFGLYKETSQTKYQENVKKFRDALNAAAPELNKALEEAAAGTTPPLKVVCDLPPPAGDTPGIDASRCPAKPYPSNGGIVYQNFQVSQLGSLVNTNKAGVFGYCAGVAEGFKPLSLLDELRWKSMDYLAEGRWTCVVVGQADAIGQTSIPKPGPLWIDCPFPSAVGSEKSASCERGSTVALTIGANVTSKVLSATFKLKYGEQLTFGLDFSHESQSVFITDGTVTKLRAGTKVTISGKNATIRSLEQEFAIGGSNEYIGLAVTGGVSEELAIGTGASNFFTTTKDLTRQQLEDELRRRYAMIAGVAATIAQMNDNRPKFSELNGKTIKLYKRPQQNAPGGTEVARIVGASCEIEDGGGDADAIDITDPVTQHDEIKCDDDGGEDPTGEAPITGDPNATTAPV